MENNNNKYIDSLIEKVAELFDKDKNQKTREVGDIILELVASRFGSENIKALAMCDGELCEIDTKDSEKVEKSVVFGYKIWDNYFIISGVGEIDDSVINKFLNRINCKFYHIKNTGGHYVTTIYSNGMQGETIDSLSKKIDYKYAKNNNNNCLFEAIYNAFVNSGIINDCIFKDEKNSSENKKICFFDEKNKHLKVGEFLKDILVTTKKDSEKAIDDMIKCLFSLLDSKEKYNLKTELEFIKAASFRNFKLYYSNEAGKSSNLTCHAFLFNGEYYTILDNNVMKISFNKDAGCEKKIIIKPLEDNDLIRNSEVINNYIKQCQYSCKFSDEIAKKDIYNPCFELFEKWNANKKLPIKEYFTNELIVSFFKDEKCISFVEKNGNHRDYSRELINTLNEEDLVDILLCRSVESTNVLCDDVLKVLKEKNGGTSYIVYKLLMNDTKNLFEGIDSKYSVSDIRSIINSYNKCYDKFKKGDTLSKKLTSVFILSEFLKNDRIQKNKGYSLVNLGDFFVGDGDRNDEEINRKICLNNEDIIFSVAGNAQSTSTESDGGANRGFYKTYGRIDKNVFGADNIVGNGITVIRKFDTDTGAFSNVGKAAVLKIEKGDADSKKTYYSIYCTGPNYNDCKNVKQFFKNLKITLDNYNKALTCTDEKNKESIFKNKFVTFSGFSNSIYAARLANRKMSKDVNFNEYEDFNIVDLYNAFYIRKNWNEIEKSGVNILLANGVSRAYKYLDKVLTKEKGEIDLNKFCLEKDEGEFIKECFNELNKGNKTFKFSFTETTSKIVCGNKGHIGSRLSTFSESEFNKALITDNTINLINDYFENIDGKTLVTVEKIFENIKNCDNDEQKVLDVCSKYIKEVDNECIKNKKDLLQKSDSYIFMKNTVSVLSKSENKKSLNDLKKEIANSILEDKDYKEKHNSLQCSYEVDKSRNFVITITSSKDDLANNYKIKGVLPKDKSIEEILLEVPQKCLNNVIESYSFKLFDTNNKEVNVRKITQNCALYKAFEFGPKVKKQQQIQHENGKGK